MLVDIIMIYLACFLPFVSCQKEQKISISKSSIETGLSAEDLKTFIGDESLYRSLTSSDCHSDIASRLGHLCYGTEDRQITEHDRRGIAISFTLCSMQSALQPAPNECLPWSQHIEQQRLSQNTGSIVWPSSEHNSSHQQSRCLGAIHRSPQEWTSYNAFLRDATQLCHVLQGERQTALAKELYVNATKEKLVLLRHLKTREHAQELREQMLENYFKNHQAELKISHDEATQTYTSIQNGIEQYKVLAQDMRSAIETMDDSKDQLWREVENELKSNINMAGILMKEEFTSLRDDWMDKISVGLQELVNEHGSKLNNERDETLTSLRSLNTYLESTTQNFHLQQTQSLQRFGDLQTSWENAMQFVDNLNIGLERLGDDISILQESVNRNLKMSIHVASLQDATAASINSSAQAVHQVLEHLNNTETRLTYMSDLVVEATNKFKKFPYRYPYMSLFSSPSLMRIEKNGSWSLLIYVLKGILFLLDMCWNCICYMLSAACCFVFIPRLALRNTMARLWQDATHRSTMDEEGSIPHTPVKIQRNVLPPSYHSVDNDNHLSVPQRKPFVYEKHHDKFQPHMMLKDWQQRGHRSCTAPL
ncbi:hypothetical protein L204_102423 [Cryptococcus depauperatus]